MLRVKNGGKTLIHAAAPVTQQRGQVANKLCINMHEIKIAIMTDNRKLCSGNSIDDATDTNSSGHSSLLPLQPPPPHDVSAGADADTAKWLSTRAQDCASKSQGGMDDERA